LPVNVSTTELRPFAFKVRGDDIYVGLVSSGESGGDLYALVYEFDENSSPSSPTFSKVLEFPLNYDRGCGFASPNGCAGPAKWNAWVDNFPSYQDIAMPMFTSAGNANEEAHPQASLCDIEFDVEGNMIIGLRDRFGDQTGFDAPRPDGAIRIYPPTGTPIYINPATGGITLSNTGIGYYVGRQDAFGDILKAQKNGSNWTVDISAHTDNSLSVGVSQAGILICPDSESSFGADCYHADGFFKWY